MSDTPRTDALIEEGAESQNQYLTKAFVLSRKLERELAAMTKQRDELAFSWSGCATQVRDACKELSRKEKECAELRPDALRYRWIRAERPWGVEHIVRGIEKELLPAGDIFISLDAAIDAAMGEKP